MANEHDALSPPDALSVTITALDPIQREGNYIGSLFSCTMTIAGDLSVARTIYWQAVGSGDHPADAADFGGGAVDGVMFNPGETTKNFTFWVYADYTLEPDETFIVTAFDPASQSNYGTAAEFTILTDDTRIGITALTPSLREDSNDGAEFLFEVQRWGDLSQTDILPWTVATEYSGFSIGSNFAGGVLPQGVVTFAPGETSKTIAVKAAPDAVAEIDMRFRVEIAGDGRIPFGSSASATILNDDATVELRRISNQVEGNSGTTDYVFELIRTGDTSVAHSVSWTASAFPLDGMFPDSLGTYSADAADFVGGIFPTGTVTFAPGETRKTFAVPVAGDTLSETGEEFRIQISDPSPGLAIKEAWSWGYITNDDPLPVVAHDDAYVTIEGGAVALSLFPPPGPGILGNDIGATAVALGLGPRHGTLELGARGLFTYRPDAGFHGIDSFTYTAAGPDGYDYGQATIHVVPVVRGQVPTLDLLALTPEEQIAATYTAFMGRAADADGFAFWVDQFHTGLSTQGAKALIADIASSFAISDEAKGLYTFLANPDSASDVQISTFLGSVYENLFNRATDAAGLAYWTGQIRQKLAGGEFVGSVLVDIMSGAQHQVSGLVLNGNFATAVIVPDDLGTLMGKVAVSLEFVRAQQEHGMVWNGAADTAAATDLLKDIYSGTGSILVGIKNGDDYVAAHA